MTWKAEKTVDVTVNYKDKDRLGQVGWCNKPVYKLVDGEWVKTDETEVLFGYCQHDFVTHMSYTLNHSLQDSWSNFVDGPRPEDPEFNKFYFDAGSNGCPLYIMRDELRRALTELGLIND